MDRVHTQPEPIEEDLRNERITRLGTAQTEAEAHLIAGELEDAGLRVRVTGMPTIGMAFPGSSQFCVDVMIFERDYERAREIYENMPTGVRLIDSKGRCVMCRYDMSGVDAPICPECGADLEALGEQRAGFRLDPPPRPPGALQHIVSAIGLFGVLSGLGVILTLIVLFISKGLSGWAEILS